MPLGVEGPSPLVYSPKTLGEALALFVPNPQAQVLAGGTAFQSEHLSSLIRLAPVTISLHLADDLKKVAYGERFLDLGGALSLNQILAVSDVWVPAVLKTAVRAVGTSVLRNVATLGGNLCQQKVLGDLFPVLHLLGAQFELRNLRGSRWLSSQEVAEKGTLVLQPGEIMTRIRLPQEQWSQGLYEKIGNIRTPWDERLALTSLVRTKEGQLEALRLSFHLPHSGLIRLKELEAELAGQSLPLPARARAMTLERIDDAVAQLPVPASTFQRDRILHMTKWVITRLDDE